MYEDFFLFQVLPYQHLKIFLKILLVSFKPFVWVIYNSDALNLINLILILVAALNLKISCEQVLGMFF